MLLKPLTFHAPQTLKEASRLYAELQNVKIQAGGTFLLNSLKLLKRKGVKTPQHVLSLSKIPDLNGITLKNDKIIIGAMTTIDEIFESNNLVDNLAVFKTVCRNISTQPIRNVATIGGNLTCRYTWTEMPAVIIGLEGKMHFIDNLGKEHIVDPEDFFKNGAKTEHLLTHVTIPRQKDVSISYRRIKKSQYVDIPLLSLIICTDIAGGKFNNTIVSVNNCVAFAKRDKKLESFLNSSTVSDTIAQQALDHLDETIYDTRSSEYKKRMFRTCIKSAIEELAKKA